MSFLIKPESNIMNTKAFLYFNCYSVCFVLFWIKRIFGGVGRQTPPLSHPSIFSSVPWEAPALVTLRAHPPAQAYKIDYSPHSLILKVTLGLTTRREQAAPNSKLILKVLQRDFAVSLRSEKRQSQYMMTYTRLGRFSQSLSLSIFVSVFLFLLRRKT